MDPRRRSRSPVRGRRSPPRHARGGPGGGGGGGGANRRGMNFRPGCLVYMASLPFDVRWMDLKNLILEKAGEVNFVELLQTKDGRPKGTAVVEFKSRADAEKCIENMNKTELGNRTIEVSSIREPDRFFESLRMKAGIDFLGQGDRAGGGPNRGGPGPNQRNMNVAQFESYGIPPQILREARIDGPLLNRVFVAGLPFHVQASRVRDLFSIAGKVDFVETLLDKEGAGTGRAIVTFRHPVEAVQAILLLNRQRFYERPIEVKFDRHDPPKQRGHNEFPIGLAGIGKGFGPNGEADPNIVERMVRTGCLPAGVMDVGGGPAPVVPGVGIGAGGMMGGGGGMAGGMGAMGDGGMMGMGGGGISGMRDDGFSGSMDNGSGMGGMGGGFGGSASRLMDMGSGSNGMFQTSGGGAMSTGSGGGGVALGGVWNNAAIGSSDSFGAGSGGIGGISMAGGAGMMGGGDGLGGGASGYGGGLTGGSYMQMGGGGGGGMGGGGDAIGYGRYDRGISRDRSPPPMPRGGGGGGGGGRMRPGGEPGSKISIRNLPGDFPWQELKDLARKAGDVEFVECQDGVGKVQYRTRSDAEKAQRYFDNYLFEGRYLDVRTD